MKRQKIETPWDLKPLFIPLKRMYFEKFANGSKDTEYRVYGKRWNERTCPAGRVVILSLGYGKQNRLCGIIGGSNISESTEDFIAIFGVEKQCFAIKILLCDACLAKMNIKVTPSN